MTNDSAANGQAGQAVPQPQAEAPRKAPAGVPVSLAQIAPDMAPNVGAVIRLAACFRVPLAVVEPCGFPFSPRAWRRQAMDYERHAEVAHLPGLGAFAAGLGGRRAIALSAHGAVALPAFAFRPGDVLMLGSETAGLSVEARALAGAAVRIPMSPPARSLNVAQAAAIALFEALRQTGGLPAEAWGPAGPC